MEVFTHGFVLNKGEAGITEPVTKENNMCLVFVSQPQKTYKQPTQSTVSTQQHKERRHTEATHPEWTKRITVGGRLSPTMDPLGSFG